MPVKRDDASLALNILEKLAFDSPKGTQLYVPLHVLIHVLDSSVGQAASRIATIFNSRLFNALLDIQDYYELHLHKNSVSNKISQFETFEVTVERYASGLGFSITGGIDSPVSPSGTKPRFELFTSFRHSYLHFENHSRRLGRHQRKTVSGWCNSED